MMRTTRRFAVRHSAKLKPARGRAAEGLLVELSLDGCRISGMDNERFIVGQPARIALAGFDPFEAHVRWSQDGVVGLCFVRALTAGLLDALVKTCRVPAAA